VELADDDLLFRRIRPDNINRDGTLNPGAFSLRLNETNLSVDLALLTTAEESLARSGRSDLGITMISVGAVRAAGLEVVRDPVAADPATGTPQNDAHALIVGWLDRPTRRKLTNSATIIIPPTRSTGSDSTP
jgi:hypothetical protein